MAAVNIPTCGQCKQCVRVPKLLACQHSFCLACLEAMPRTSSDRPALRCPICNAETDMTGRTFEDLPSNRLLQWMADRAKPQPETQRQDQADCGHNWAENRQLCEHCNGRFCADCQVRHKELMKVDIFDLYEAFKERRAGVDEAKVEEGLAAVRRRFDDEIAAIRAGLAESTESAVNALKRQAERSFDESKRQCDGEFVALTGRIEAARQMCPSLMQVIEDVKATSVLNMQLDEVARLHRAMGDCVAAVEAMEDPLGAVATYRMEAPQPEFDLAKKYLESGRFLGVLLAQRPTARCQQDPRQMEAQPPSEHLGEANFQVYDKMEMVAAISGNDRIGHEIRRPSVATTIHDGKYSTAAICHNGNRISLMNTRGQLLCTYLLYDPDDISTDVSFVDMASDANRVFVTDLSQRILALDLRFATMPPGGAVIPVIFARCSSPSAGAGFRGLAVSFHRSELYTCEGADLVAFSLTDGSVRFRSHDPDNWRRRVLAIRDLSPGGDLSTIVYLSDDGQSIVSQPIQNNGGDSVATVIAEPGVSVGKIRGVRPGGIAFDSCGNIFIADNLNERIQIFSNCLAYVECFKPSVCSHLFDPWSLTCLQVNPDVEELDDETMMAAMSAKARSEETASSSSSSSSKATISGGFEDLASMVVVVTDCLPGRILLFAPKKGGANTWSQAVATTTTCEL